MKFVNKITKLSCIVLVMIAFSCQDLVEDPKGSLVSESFFKTENDLQAAVTACYRPLINNPWGAIISTRAWIPLMGGDDLTTHPAWNKADFREFDRFVGQNLNSGLMGSAWQNQYKIVQSVANVMENYEKVNAREDIKLGLVAQARFLRAFAYYWMVRIYGDLPLVTTVATDLNIELSPVSAIYDLIVEDLTFAANNLPDSYPGAPGKPNKWTAKSLLASVYLTMAGWPLKDTSKYALAASTAKDVIDNGPYVLLPNFKDLWLMKNDNNAEFIWTVQVVGIEGNPAMSTIGGLPTMPDEENGWDDVFFEIGFMNRFPAGPRKDATFHTKFLKTQNGVVVDTIDYTESITGHPFIAKYRDGALNWEKETFTHDYMTPRNINYLRFAEILLTYAEANAMAGTGPDASCYDAINRVRTRAGLPNLTPGLSQIAFRDAVVDERGWELAAEYSRWFDLVRTEKVEEFNALDKKAPATATSPGDLTPLAPVNKSKYLSPIPYDEILLNPNLANGTKYN
ncbi:MAG: RagB/SusD family nutrient uptake outer membrane protein [Mangrovibacterium sp.]